MRVYRHGKNLDLPITVAEMESDEPKPAKAEPPAKIEKPVPAAHPTAAKLGLELVDLTDTQKKDNKLNGGARVSSASGVAASGGLREGDVIVAIANTEVSSAKDAEAVLAKLGNNKPIAMQIRRGDRGNFVLIKPQSIEK
jgi:serine protease Do